VGDATVDFRLGNGEALHHAAPRSFIPGRAERDSLRAGDAAKILFEIIEPRPGMPTAERMWVSVTGRDPDGYTGVLTNVPSVITTIRQGDTIRFGPEHVISTPGGWPLLAKKILVSRRSHEQDLRPRWVYREEPDNDHDSGWRALVGDETDDELNHASGILLQELGFVLDRWPEIRPVIKTIPRTAAGSGTSRPGDTYLPPRLTQIDTFGSPYPVAAEHARTRRTADLEREASASLRIVASAPGRAGALGWRGRLVPQKTGTEDGPGSGCQ
jgi:hypothetical protein